MMKVPSNQPFHKLTWWVSGWNQMAQNTSITAKEAMNRKVPHVIAHSWKVKLRVRAV